MFKYHKYCVIEVSGHLEFCESKAGSFSVYLVDGAEVRGSDADRGQPDGPGDKIKIADPDLIEFLRANLLSQGGFPSPGCVQARVTGTVGMDGNEVQLLEVSEALFKDKEKTIRFRPKSRGRES